MPIGTIALIGGALSLASTVGGGVASALKNREAEALRRRQQQDNRLWRDVKMAEDYTQRPDVQAAVNKQRELLEEYRQRARGAQVVAGASEESVALQQEAANKAMSDTMATIAAQGAARKDQIDQQYRAQEAQLNQQEIAAKQQEAANIAQAASQAAAAGASLAGMAGTNNVAPSTPPAGSNPLQGEYASLAQQGVDKGMREMQNKIGEGNYTTDQIQQAIQNINEPWQRRR